MYARHFTHAILFHLASCPMKGRELTFVQCLTMCQALCMKLLCTSWSRTDHPHFTGEDDWGSETLNSLPYKSSGVRIKVVMPNLKVHSPKCTTVLPRAAPPQEPDEKHLGSWLTFCSNARRICWVLTQHCGWGLLPLQVLCPIQKQKATYFFLCMSHHSLGQWFSKRGP